MVHARIVGQDVAPVDADHWIVVFEEELVLVITEHDHHVGVDLGERVLQLVQPLLDAVELADEDVLVDVLSDLGTWINNNREFIADFGKILGVIAIGFAAISAASSPYRFERSECSTAPASCWFPSYRR